jgi:malonate transporter
MTSTIISALLPVVVTLLLGFAAGLHHDFDAKQATILNRLVMLSALPLSLFVGMLGTPRDEVLAQGRLALGFFWRWSCLMRSSWCSRIRSFIAIS